jgi:acyl dehydratase
MDYFEDLSVGDTAAHGSHEFTADGIVGFAEQYDPQPFHTDPEAARDTAFGELVASGWHTASTCMRLYVDGILSDRAGMGARGVDELRWRQPVRPGDELHIETEILDTRISGSDPHRGYVDERLEGLVGEDVVISWISLAMVERNSPGE